MTSRLAIVPARGGSKRIPDKNVRQFCGRPMMAYILDAARQSGLFDVIHISTESDRIAAIAENLGFPVAFLRPAELADDHTPLMPVLRHAAETFALRSRCFDEVWMLMACAPLIEAEDLRAAARLFAASGGDRPVLPVAPYPAPVEWAFERREDGSLVPVQPQMMGVRSQDLRTRYYDTGSFCVLPARRVLESEGPGEFTGYIGHLLPPGKAIDIDSEDDWRVAEIMYAGSGAVGQK